MPSIQVLLIRFLNGVAMGAANVIPGVSGGTIAFVTGIYETLIDSLKSFDIKALQLASRLKVIELAKHLNLAFLVPLLLGVGVALISLGKLLEFLFVQYSTLVWSFFFGLILASVYYVSKNIRQRTLPVGIAFAVGLALALALSFVKPAEENDALLYVAICGVVAMCSMILPGLSGSFVLILMGNYQLLMLQAIPNMNIRLLAPFAVGAGVGFIGLSHLISFLLRRFHDATLSVLTGFILGSLATIWPWKSELHLTGEDGALLLKDGEPIVKGYEWNAPDFALTETYLCLGLIFVGMVAVALLERSAAQK